MSENETTLEEKILTVGILSFFFGLGFWARSVINSPLLDGLVLIATIGLGVLVFAAAVLLSFDGDNEP